MIIFFLVPLYLDSNQSSSRFAFKYFPTFIDPLQFLSNRYAITKYRSTTCSQNGRKIRNVSDLSSEPSIANHSSTINKIIDNKLTTRFEIFPFPSPNLLFRFLFHSNFYRSQNGRKIRNLGFPSQIIREHSLQDRSLEWRDQFEIVPTIVIVWFIIEINERLFAGVSKCILLSPSRFSSSLLFASRIYRARKKKRKKQARRALIVDEIPLFQRANFVSLNKVDSIAAFLPFTARIQFLGTTTAWSIALDRSRRGKLDTPSSFFFRSLLAQR